MREWKFLLVIICTVKYKLDRLLILVSEFMLKNDFLKEQARFLIQFRITITVLTYTYIYYKNLYFFRIYK